MISKKDALAILDKMDDFRRRHQDERQSPSDWCMRVLEAIVAESAGIQGRMTWTEELRKDETTKYFEEYNNSGILFRW